MARNSRHARTRTRSRHTGGTAVARPLPQAVLAAATRLAATRDARVRPADRARLVELISRAHGRGINLSQRDRTELAVIVGRAEATPAPGARLL